MVDWYQEGNSLESYDVDNPRIRTPRPRQKPEKENPIPKAPAKGCRDKDMRCAGYNANSCYNDAETCCLTCNRIKTKYAGMMILEIQICFYTDKFINKKLFEK